MKLLKNLIPTIALLMSTSSYANSPVSVNIGTHYNAFRGVYVPTITVTAITNQIVVNNVTANRGNCMVYTDQDLVGSAFNAYNQGQDPSKIQYQTVKQLQYGQSVFYKTKNCDRLLEIVVDTNQGSWTFTPNR